MQQDNPNKTLLPENNQPGTTIPQPINTQQESAPPPIPTSAVNPSQVPVKYGGRKIIATIFVIALLLIGLVPTVILVQRQLLITGRAADCSQYVFEVSKDGQVTVRNGSTRDMNAQKAEVFINDQRVQTFNVPALPSGEASSLGVVTVPTNGFTWKINGTTDCKNNGSYTSSEAKTSVTTASSSNVKAYTKNWTPLRDEELSQLKPGTVVRFTVSGTATSGSFDKAKFIINGEERPEVTQKKPDSEEFYEEYTIPSGVKTFTISAQVYHSYLGWF